MDRLRVLVADDSPTVRARLVAALLGDPGIAVVGEAADGHDAVALCHALRPDVITLDLAMPGLSGLAATEQIMAYAPTPILIVSGRAERGTQFGPYDALAAGAVEACEKPDIGEGAAWDARFVALVRRVARIKVITHPRARLRPGAGGAPPAPDALAPAAARVARGRRPALIVIGASTCGPGAVAAVLRGLPPGFGLPILLVIHIGAPFGASLAAWLGDQAPMPVRLAADGEPLPGPGSPGVWLAPPERHLVVRGGRLRLDAGPERNYCRPSVDVLFESAAQELGARAAGCLLTGMGRDGAAGLLALRQAGAATIAQDEATSVVWGMPREAVRLGAAESQLPLEAIAGALIALAAGNGTQEEGRDGGGRAER